MCPGGIKGDGFGGYSYMDSKNFPFPGGTADIDIESDSPRRLGVLLLGVEGAQFERAGCPLIFAPKAYVPFLTGDFGSTRFTNRSDSVDEHGDAVRGRERAAGAESREERLHRVLDLGHAGRQDDGQVEGAAGRNRHEDQPVDDG